jgi:exodeoxyribonuclease V gamma subunit
VQWDRLDPEPAAAELIALRRLAQQGQHRCWPVPPESGWLLMAKEHRKAGSGVKAFRESWRRERDTPTQQLCFGLELEAEVLLESPGFQQACKGLYQPMLTALTS